jgi:hypothetical protein
MSFKVKAGLQVNTATVIDANGNWIGPTISTSTNLAAGTAGQLVYQSASGVTSYTGPGSAGQLLVSNGSSAPTYTNTASIYVGNSVNAEKWTTARTVTFAGGDVTGNFTIDGSANVSDIALTIAADSVTLGTDTTGVYLAQGATSGFGLSGSANAESATFTVTANSTSSNTVSTIVYRDASGNFSAGTITATAFNGPITGTATTATNIAGGTAGQIHIQSGSGTTAFIPVGSPGQFLQAGTNTATFVSTSSMYVDSAVRAEKWTTARTFTFGGDLTGSMVVDGSQNVTFTATIAANSVALGTDTTGVYVAQGATSGFGLSGSTNAESATFTVTANSTSSNTVSTIVYRDGSGNFSAGTITATTFSGSGSGLTGIPNSALTSSTITVSAGNAGVGISGSPVSLGGTVSVTNLGVLSFSGGTTGLTPANATTGTVTLGGTLALANGGTNKNNTAVAGAFVYSDATGIAVGTTGTAGTVLVSGGTATPVWQNTLTLAGTTQATSTQTGAVQVRGGVGIGGNLYVGNSATILSTVASTTTVANNALYVAGGVGIGGSLYVTGAAVFQNDVVFSGTTTYVFSTQTVITDNIINLHTPTGGVAGAWTVNDGKDIGLVFHNYKGADNDSFLGWANDSGYLEWYGTGQETVAGTFTNATYGIFKTGGIVLVNTTASSSTITGALTVAGGVGIGGNLYVGGTLYQGGVAVSTTNTTYSLTAQTTSTGNAASIRLTDSNSLINNVNIVGTGTITVSRTDAGTITLSSAGSLESSTSNITNAAAVAVDTFPIATYRSAEYTYSVKVTAGTTHYATGKLLVLHDGSTTYITQWAMLQSNQNDELVIFAADISAGTILRLLAQATTGNTITVKLNGITYTTV